MKKTKWENLKKTKPFEAFIFESFCERAYEAGREMTNKLYAEIKWPMARCSWKDMTSSTNPRFRAVVAGWAAAVAQVIIDCHAISQLTENQKSKCKYSPKSPKRTS